MSLSEQKRTALRVRDHIISKLNRLKCSRSEEHELSNVFYILGFNVPEKYINQALAATDDRVYNQNKPLLKGHHIDQYFLGVLRNVCKKKHITSGLKKWDNKILWEEFS